jgi:hypothetical protein
MNWPIVEKRKRKNKDRPRKTLWCGSRYCEFATLPGQKGNCRTIQWHVLNSRQNKNVIGVGYPEEYKTAAGCPPAGGTPLKLPYSRFRGDQPAGRCCCCCCQVGNSWVWLLPFRYSFEYPHVPTQLAAAQGVEGSGMAGPGETLGRR